MALHCASSLVTPVHSRAAMIAGHLPYEDQNTAKLYDKILRADYKCPRWLSSAARDLLGKMFQTDPQCRATIADIRRHPWYTQVMVPSQPVKSQPTSLEELNAHVVAEAEALGISRLVLAEHLMRNAHNNITATYYLLVERQLRSGSSSEGGGGGTVAALTTRAGAPDAGASRPGTAVASPGRPASGAATRASANASAGARGAAAAALAPSAATARPASAVRPATTTASSSGGSGTAPSRPGTAAASTSAGGGGAAAAAAASKKPGSSASGSWRGASAPPTARPGSAGSGINAPAAAVSASAAAAGSSRAAPHQTLADDDAQPPPPANATAKHIADPVTSRGVAPAAPEALPATNRQPGAGASAKDTGDEIRPAQATTAAGAAAGANDERRHQPKSQQPLASSSDRAQSRAGRAPAAVESGVGVGAALRGSAGAQGAGGPPPVRPLSAAPVRQEPSVTAAAADASAPPPPTATPRIHIDTEQLRRPPDAAGPPSSGAPTPPIAGAVPTRSRAPSLAGVGVPPLSLIPHTAAAAPVAPPPPVMPTVPSETPLLLLPGGLQQAPQPPQGAPPRAVDTSCSDGAQARPAGGPSVDVSLAERQPAPPALDTSDVLPSMVPAVPVGSMSDRQRANKRSASSGPSMQRSMRAAAASANAAIASSADSPAVATVGLTLASQQSTDSDARLGGDAPSWVLSEESRPSGAGERSTAKPAAATPGFAAPNRSLQTPEPSGKAAAPRVSSSVAATRRRPGASDTPGDASFLDGEDVLGAADVTLSVSLRDTTRGFGGWDDGTSTLAPEDAIPVTPARPDAAVLAATSRRPAPAPTTGGPSKTTARSPAAEPSPKFDARRAEAAAGFAASPGTGAALSPPHAASAAPAAAAAAPPASSTSPLSPTRGTAATAAASATVEKLSSPSPVREQGGAPPAAALVSAPPAAVAAAAAASPLPATSAASPTPPAAAAPVAVLSAPVVVAPASAAAVAPAPGAYLRYSNVPGPVAGSEEAAAAAPQARPTVELPQAAPQGRSLRGGAATARAAADGQVADPPESPLARSNAVPSAVTAAADALPTLASRPAPPQQQQQRHASPEHQFHPHSPTAASPPVATPLTVSVHGVHAVSEAGAADSAAFAPQPPLRSAAYVQSSVRPPPQQQPQLLPADAPRSMTAAVGSRSAAAGTTVALKTATLEIDTTQLARGGQPMGGQPSPHPPPSARGSGGPTRPSAPGTARAVQQPVPVAAGGGDSGAADVTATPGAPSAWVPRGGRSSSVPPGAGAGGDWSWGRPATAAPVPGKAGGGAGGFLGDMLVTGHAGGGGLLVAPTATLLQQQLQQQLALQEQSDVAAQTGARQQQHSGHMRQGHRRGGGHAAAQEAADGGEGADGAAAATPTPGLVRDVPTIAQAERSILSPAIQRQRQHLQAVYGPPPYVLPHQQLQQQQGGGGGSSAAGAATQNPGPTPNFIALAVPTRPAGGPSRASRPGTATAARRGRQLTVARNYPQPWNPAAGEGSDGSGGGGPAAPVRTGGLGRNAGQDGGGGSSSDWPSTAPPPPSALMSLLAGGGGGASADARQPTPRQPPPQQPQQQQQPAPGATQHPRGAAASLAARTAWQPLDEPMFGRQPPPRPAQGGGAGGRLMMPEQDGDGSSGGRQQGGGGGGAAAGSRPAWPVRPPSAAATQPGSAAARAAGGGGLGGDRAWGCRRPSPSRPAVVCSDAAPAGDGGGPAAASPAAPGDLRVVVVTAATAACGVRRSRRRGARLCRSSRVSDTAAQGGVGAVAARRRSLALRRGVLLPAGRAQCAAP